MMVFGYADPPYFGCAVKHYSDHPEAAVYDTLDGHRVLIERLCDEYADGWALSMNSTNLRDLLPLCPPDVRIGAWVKPFAIFKPNVQVAYAWEPLVFRGGRKRGRDVATVRDWVSANITLQRGMTGAKPVDFCRWVIALMGPEPDDEMHDLFLGSSAVTRVFDAWREAWTGDCQIGMFGPAPVSGEGE